LKLPFLSNRQKVGQGLGRVLWPPSRIDHRHIGAAEATFGAHSFGCSSRHISFAGYRSDVSNAFPFCDGAELF
jgi:hypothetical protein